MSSYIAFLDLLGVKDIAKFHFEKYYKAMVNFQKNILMNLESEEHYKYIKIKYFSDCFFAESDDICKLINYLMQVRTTAMSQEHYFKAAITYGKLLPHSEKSVDTAINNIESRNALPLDVNKATILLDHEEISSRITRLSDSVEGVAFLSPDVCRVFELENTFKGVGILVDDTLVADIKDSGNKKLMAKFVESYYVTNAKKNSITGYFDIKIEQENISFAHISQILKTITMALIGSKSVGTKYLSLIATLINSENYDLSIDEHISGGLDVTSGLIKTLLSLKKDHSNIYKNMAGTQYLYISILNNLYNNNKINDADIFIEHLIRTKSPLSKFEGSFDSIPTPVMSRKNISLLKKSYYAAIIKKLDAQNNKSDSVSTHNK